MTDMYEAAVDSAPAAAFGHGRVLAVRLGLSDMRRTASACAHNEPDPKRRLEAQARQAALADAIAVLDSMIAGTSVDAAVRERVELPSDR